METISNMTQAASKVIWGTPSSQEPVSGKTGDVAKGEPYDAGNMGDPPEHVEDVHQATPQHEKKQDATLPTSSEVEKSMTALSGTSNQQSDNVNTSSGVHTTTSNIDTTPNNKTTSNNTTKTNDVPAINPTKLKDSSHGPGDASLDQNDVRSPSDPAVQPDNVQAKENVDDTHGGLDVGDNPVKLDGPGPRPVAEVAKEHGGDAGKANEKVAGDSSSSSSNSSASDLNKKKTEEEEDPKEGSNKGLLYVRSSGLNADGGDFDATKPGAGREADRLLEQKGVTRDPNSGGVAGDLPESHKEKKSLKEKIKAKLHKVGPNPSMDK
ncbi:hypothetical protein V8F06_003160 [Rhypophila decipiens]